MSTLLLTSLANVKEIMPNANATLDDELNALIESVSRRAENFIGRDFEQTSRTETYDIGRRTKAIFLRNYPIISVTEIKNHIRRDFAAASVMDSDLYAVDSETGRVFFEGALVTGAGVLQVTYTGGLAADQNGLLALTDLEYAARRQVLHEYNRRNTPGAKPAVSSRRRAAEFEGEGQVDWLTATRDVLTRYKGNFIQAFGILP